MQHKAQEEFSNGTEKLFPRRLERPCNAAILVYDYQYEEESPKGEGYVRMALVYPVEEIDKAVRAVEESGILKACMR